MKRFLQILSSTLALLSALFILTGFDETTLLLITYIRTPTITRMMHVVAFLGSVRFLLPLNLLMIWREFPKKKYDALRLPSATLLVWFFNHMIKITTKRPRPKKGAIALESSLSFPSGHAMVNSFFILALTLRHYKKHRSKKIFIPSGLYILLMCFNRLYLGVHYPSDVLAGGSLGIILSVLFFPDGGGRNPSKIWRVNHVFL